MKDSLHDFESDFLGRTQEMRDLVKRIVTEINSPRFHYIDGAQALNPALGLTTDLVHPSPSGMISIGEWAAKSIRPLLP